MNRVAGRRAAARRLVAVVRRAPREREAVHAQRRHRRLRERRSPWTGPGPTRSTTTPDTSAPPTASTAFNVYTVSKTAEPAERTGAEDRPQLLDRERAAARHRRLPGRARRTRSTTIPSSSPGRRRRPRRPRSRSRCARAPSCWPRPACSTASRSRPSTARSTACSGEYPKAMVKNGRRFVDNGRVVTTAGHLRRASTARCTWWRGCSAAASPTRSRPTWSTTGRRTRSSPPATRT